MEHAPDGKPSAGALAVLALMAATATAQCTTEWLPGSAVPGVDDQIWAMAVHDPDGPGPQSHRLILSGRFEIAGDTYANRLASFDPANGVWSEFGGGIVHGDVADLLSLPNGDLIAAGSFGMIGGVAASNIARWDGTTWHPLGAGTNLSVETLARAPNGDLVVGGNFTLAGGALANRIARWDGSQWHPLGGGYGGYMVEAIAVRGNGNVVIGGYAPNVPGSNVHEWDGSTWSPLGNEVGGLARIYSILVQPNGDLVAGGDFLLNGSPSQVARWNGATWSTLGAGFNSAVHALAQLPGGDILAAGRFRTAGSQALDRIARWNGTSWSRLTASPEIAVSGLEHVDALAIDGQGRIYAGGSFRAAGARPCLNVAAFDGSEWRPLTPGTWVPIAALLAEDDGLVVGGEFTHIVDVPAANIARYDGNSWSALGAGTNGEVRAILRLPGGDLVVGGEFSFAGNVAANGIAIWDGSAWHDLPGANFASVEAIAFAANGDVLVGATLGGGGDAVWRFDGTGWSSLPGLGGAVAAITTLPQGDIVAAGLLSAPANAHVARWNGTSWSAMGALSPPFPGAYDIAVQPNGDLVLAGWFTHVDGVAANNVARWDGATWHPLGNGLPGGVLELQPLQNDDVVAFTTDLNRVVRWDGATWSTIGSGGERVPAMAVAPDGTLTVAGRFYRINQVISAGLARWRPGCPASATPLAPACASTGGPMDLRVTQQPWIAGTLRAECHGLAPAGLAAVLIGLTSPNTPLGALHPLGVAGCNLHASAEVVVPQFQVQGTAGFQLPIANDPVFAGTSFFTQVVQLELDPLGNLLAITASNALQLTVGTY